MSVVLGLIGCGAIGEVHARAANRAGVTLAGVSDIKLAAAEALAQRHGVSLVASNNEELIRRPEIQGIIVATPNDVHADIAIEAMEAGKDVLCQKPMALNAQQCRMMNEAAQANERILQIGFVHRYTPVARTAKALIDAGRVGAIYHAKAAIYRRRGIPGLGGWFTTKARSGGGPLIDLGVHLIDLAMYLMDFPKVQRVSAKVYANFGKDLKKYVYEEMWAGPPDYQGVCDVEDAAHALVRLENGATLEVNATWAGNFPEKSLNNIVGIYGDTGGVAFEMGGTQVQLATQEHGHNVDIIPKLRSVDHFEEEIKSFAQSMTQRTEAFASGRQGQIVQSIIDAIYESSELDREVEL